MECALRVVTAGPLDLDVPFGEHRLARGSLVRDTGQDCPGGEIVTVAAVNRRYPVATPAAVGEVACLSTLAPVTDLRFVAQRDGPVEVVDAATACAADDVSDLRPIDATTLASVIAVRDAYARLWGPLPLHRVPWTDWGRVGLPLAHELTAEEIAAEYARERLDTPARREKAIVATAPAYVHFLGADPPGSDVWGTPDTVIALMTLAHAWQSECPEARCTLQIGDLAWPSPVRPDPLGHKDHWTGTCVDLRLFRTDGSRYEAFWNEPDDRDGAAAYDRALTTRFLAFAMAHAPVTDVFFNDPEVIAAVPGLRALRGHDDHVHLCFAY